MLYLYEYIYRFSNIERLGREAWKKPGSFPTSGWATSPPTPTSPPWIVIRNHFFWPRRLAVMRQDEKNVLHLTLPAVRATWGTGGCLIQKTMMSMIEGRWSTVNKTIQNLYSSSLLFRKPGTLVPPFLPPCKAVLQKLPFRGNNLYLYTIYFYIYTIVYI